MFTITKANHHAVCLMDQGGSVMTIENDITGTLRRETHGHEPVVMQPIAFSRNDDGRDATHNLAPTMRVAGNAGGMLAAAVGTDLYNGAITGDVAATMTNRTDGTGTGPTVMQVVGFEENFNAIKETQIAPAMTTKGYGVTQNAGGLGIRQSMAVRRLTPVECERLQGFPDNYTDIQPKGKATPDGPRYKALGNSMAVPVMRWIGERISQVEAIHAP
jgi:DNA (cytosine-5)-methyltransferase 1